MSTGRKRPAEACTPGDQITEPAPPTELDVEIHVSLTPANDDKVQTIRNMKGVSIQTKPVVKSVRTLIKPKMKSIG